jgi:hypothetical protein
MLIPGTASVSGFFGSFPDINPPRKLMEVTNLQDKITHAIVGGQEVKSFTIADSPEFFHVLSNALYSDKPRAVVREVLCNAWDAHIEAGLQNIAIEVIISEGKLIIRDFAMGIADADMARRYTSYGYSDKIDDVRVTGGFGLGCKAPFAYVDHFEVISCHQGEKSIYKMSLSNAQVGGKPSFTRIVNIPTDESGLTVTINLREPQDAAIFERLVREIASMGEMKVKLNGEEIHSIPFSRSKHGFMLVKTGLFNNTKQMPVAVHYGNVVYRVAAHESYSDMMRDVEKFLEKLSSYNRWDHRGAQWTLVLQAEGSTISVTPSRESLSMTDRTIETIKSLLKQASQKLNETNLSEYFIPLTRESIYLTSLVSSPAKLCSIEHHRDQKIPNIDKAVEFSHYYLNDYDEMARYYLSQNYPESKSFRGQEILIRLQALIDSNFGNRGLNQSFKAALMKAKSEPFASTDWFHRNVFAPIIRKMQTKEHLDPKRLFVHGEKLKKRYNEREQKFIPIKEWPKKTFRELMPFLRNIVIIGYTRTAVDERAPWFPVIRHWMGSVQEGSLFYQAPRNPVKVKAARDFFEGLGMTVIDLTVRHKWEPEEEKAPVIRISTGPKKKGLPCLSALLVDGNIQTDRLWVDDCPRIIKPEFFVQLSSQMNNTDAFLAEYLGKRETLAVVRLFGTKGAAVANKVQIEKYLQMGAKSLREYLPQKILDEFQNNPEIEIEYRNSLAGHDLYHYDFRDEINAIYSDAELRAHFKLKPKCSERVADFKSLFDLYIDGKRNTNPIDQKIRDLRKTWELSSEAKALGALLQKRRMDLGLINIHRIQAILSPKSNYSKLEQEKARKMLLLAIEG